MFTSIFRKKCIYLTFHLSVTLNRTFRGGIHIDAVCYIPKNISNMDAEH